MSELKTVLVFEKPTQGPCLANELRESALATIMRLVDRRDELEDYLQAFIKPTADGICLPSLLLLDLDMADGLSILKWIRIHKNFFNLPVICVGKLSPREIQIAFDTGANAYFEKGFKVSELAALIFDLDFLSTAVKPKSFQGNAESGSVMFRTSTEWN